MSTPSRRISRASVERFTDLRCLTTLDMLKRERRFKTHAEQNIAAAPLFNRSTPRNSFRAESLEGGACVIYRTRLD